MLGTWSGWIVGGHTPPTWVLVFLAFGRWKCGPLEINSLRAELYWKSLSPSMGTSSTSYDFDWKRILGSMLPRTFFFFSIVPFSLSLSISNISNRSFGFSIENRLSLVLRRRGWSWMIELICLLMAKFIGSRTLGFFFFCPAGIIEDVMSSTESGELSFISSMSFFGGNSSWLMCLKAWRISRVQKVRYSWDRLFPLRASVSLWAWRIAWVASSDSK